MSDIYDPLAGLDPISIMLLTGMGNVPSLPAQVDRYGNEEDYDLDQYAKQGNALQDDFDMMLDPAMALMGLAMGMPTFDSMTTVQPQEIEPPPMRWTPTIDRLKNNPNTAWIAEQIEGGGTILDINQQIRQGVAEQRLTEDDAADMQAIAQQALTEFGDFSKSAAEFDHSAQFRQPELSPMEQFLRKAGLPSPTEQYSADNVTLPDVLSSSDTRDRAERMVSGVDGMRSRAAQLERGFQSKVEDAYRALPQIGRFEDDPDLRGTTEVGPNGNVRVRTTVGGGDDGLLTRAYEGATMRDAPAWMNGRGAQSALGDLSAWVNGERQATAAPRRRVRTRPNNGAAVQGPVLVQDDGRQRARALTNEAGRREQTARKLTAEAERRDAVARAKTAQNMAAQGRSPFNDTMNARLAMLQMLRGGR